MLDFLILPYKHPKKEYLQDSDLSDIKAMYAEDDEVINFAYDTAIDRMQEIKDDVKIINTRTTLLLGYLAAIVAGLLIFLFRETQDGVIFFFSESAGEIQQITKDFAQILLGFYFGNIFIVAITLVNPTFSKHANNSPELILKGDTHDIKIVKIIRIKWLTKDIEANINRLYILASWLRFSIYFTFLAPFLAFAWAYFA